MVYWPLRLTLFPLDRQPGKNSRSALQRGAGSIRDKLYGIEDITDSTK